jgi:hypothetical protein
VTDYFSELEDQLGRVTESGIHNRRRLGDRMPHPGRGLLAAATSVLVVAAVVAVALDTGSAVRSRPPALPAAGSQSGGGGAQRSAGVTPTTAGGTSYCVSSVTHARTACSPQAAAFRNEGGFPAVRPHPGAPLRLVAQLYLHALSGAKGPTAVVRVVEQGGAFGVSMLGAGLPANTKRDAYAVWLTNRRHQAKMLGFVDPPVKIDGRLKAAGVLPKDAFRYDELLITLQTAQTNPTAPGAAVLKGTFHR